MAWWRPDLRRRVRQDGQRRLDRRDHPRRDPAAAANTRGRERQSHPHRIAGRSRTGATTYKLVVAFNEQVLLARHRLGALADDAIILVENLWATHAEPRHPRRLDEGDGRALDTAATAIIEVPMEEQCLTIDENPRKGKNMFALGLLALHLRSRPRRGSRSRSPTPSARSRRRSISGTSRCLQLGYAWAARATSTSASTSRATTSDRPLVVMNGNEALALGALASGMELCAMYPITPATSVSHFLAEVFEKFGGILHQAEDEIAAAGVAIGASYAGKVAFTVTSGPGLALKTEFIGLAVMTETPLVVIDVQRGGPSTGLPTKVEQSDLLAALFAQPGDAPRIVIAPATIEECFHSVITARRLAEAFRTVVIVLERREPRNGRSAVPASRAPRRMAGKPSLTSLRFRQARDPTSGIRDTGSRTRIIPGPAGRDVHRHRPVARRAQQSRLRLRRASARLGDAEPQARRAAANAHAARRPRRRRWRRPAGRRLGKHQGRDRGSGGPRTRRGTRGVVAAPHASCRRSSPGSTEIFARFRKVTTVEINYSDEPGDPFITAENRRRGQLAWLLRAADARRRRLLDARAGRAASTRRDRRRDLAS